MKRPNITPGEWNHSKHGTPEGYPQFGIYADGAPNDFAIIKAEEPVAQAIAALPDLLAALERLLTCPDLQFDAMEPESREAMEDSKAALTKAGYTF
jgi:hypothetical protein